MKPQTLPPVIFNLHLTRQVKARPLRKLFLQRNNQINEQAKITGARRVAQSVQLLPALTFSLAYCANEKKEEVLQEIQKGQALQKLPEWLNQPKADRCKTGLLEGKNGISFLPNF